MWGRRDVRLAGRTRGQSGGARSQPELHRAREGGWSGSRVRDGLRGNPRVVLKRVRSVVRRKVGRVNAVEMLIANNGRPTNRFVAHAKAAQRHRVRRFSGTIELIRSEQWFTTLPHAPKLGWDALVDRVRLHPVACDHVGVLTDPTSIQVIVDVLKQLLPCQLV